MKVAFLEAFRKGFSSFFFYRIESSRGPLPWAVIPHVGCVVAYENMVALLDLYLYRRISWRTHETVLLCAYTIEEIHVKVEVVENMETQYNFGLSHLRGL